MLSLSLARTLRAMPIGRQRQAAIIHQVQPLSPRSFTVLQNWQGPQQ